MWDDKKIDNAARDVASRELRFIAIKETLIQMRNEDERELVECAKSNLATMARCGDLSRKLEKAQRRIDAAEESANQQCTIRYMVQDELDAAKARIAELEAQLAAALATIERAVAAWHILE